MVNIGLVHKFDHSTSGDSLGSGIDEDKLVLVGHVDIDDSLRTCKVGVLVHVRHCRFTKRFLGQTSDSEPVVLVGLSGHGANDLVVLFGKNNFSLGDISVVSSLTGHSAACGQECDTCNACDEKFFHNVLSCRRTPLLGRKVSKRKA